MMNAMYGTNFYYALSGLLVFAYFKRRATPCVRMEHPFRALVGREAPIKVCLCLTIVIGRVVTERFSVNPSEIDKGIVENHYENQAKKTFQDEYRAFLKKYQVEYDERYVGLGNYISPFQGSGFLLI